MVKHILLWKLKSEYSAEQKAEIAAKVKSGLEALPAKVPGLLKAEVTINMLPSANVDMMLYSELESEAALAAYQVNPDHLAVATYIRTVVETRTCADFII